jgi:hypothetical protein
LNSKAGGFGGWDCREGREEVLKNGRASITLADTFLQFNVLEQHINSPFDELKCCSLIFG